MSGHAPIAGRRCERLSITGASVTLVIKTKNQKTLHESQLLDISERGARLRTKIELAEGQIVGLIPRGGRGIAVYGRVVRVGKAGTDRPAELGIEFLEVVPKSTWWFPFRPKAA